MRFLITGATGMLGRDLVDLLADHDLIALGRDSLDITDLDAVRRIMQPEDIVVNCAAYTNVDAAEADEPTAFAINSIGVENLAIVCAELGVRLITISTDYVFSGESSAPYLESELRSPKSAYGRTKAAGEERALAAHPTGTTILRTAWLYGKHGSNFAQTMLNLSTSQETWSVVDDQRGQPTWSRDLSDQILALIESNAPAGIYHATNSGEATWFEFAQAVLFEAGLDPNRITRTDSSAFARPAPRPAYSVLGHDQWDAARIPPMRPWREALHAAFQAGVFTF